MANKEKLLATAQKSLQKGQISKAIKDYQKVVEVDPKDMRNRQKLAELYSRARMSDEALAEYEAVAKYYAENGFYLKSIAVYKQMQKLDPDRVGIYHRLAELNEKQGLVGNALAEYRNLVAYYEKHGMTPEAINVLQKMKDLDPENLNIRVKIGESLACGGLQDKARVEFEEVLRLLEQRRDYNRILRLYEVILPLFPEERDFRIGFARSLIEHEEIEKGIQLLRNLLKDNPDHLDILHALAHGYHQNGDFANERLTYHHLLKNLPDDLDIREGYIRSCLDGGENRRALEELEEWKETFFDGGRVVVLKSFYEELKKHLEDEQVLRTLNSIYEVTGEGDKLFDVMSVLPDEEPAAAGSEGDSAEETLDFPVLEEAVEDLEEIDELPAEADIPDELEPLDDLDFSLDLEQGEEDAAEVEEIPLEFLEEVEEAGEESCAASADLAPEAEEELELEIELELDAEDLLPEDGREASDEEQFAAHTGTDAASDSEEALDLDLGEFMAAAEGEVGTKADFREELEEAEFYLQQGLLADAERLCGSLLEKDPDCAAAREMLADVERRRRQPAGESTTEGGFFDLASEILDEGTLEAVEGSGAFAEPDRFPLEEDFSENKTGVRSQVDPDDGESHYNLGIAYKEMGLLDDAVAEFDNAMRNPSRRIDCLTLKGMCLADKGEFPLAEETFQVGLGEENLRDSERISLLYELGLLYEGWGRPEQALERFQQVADVDPFFRKAGENVQRLRRELGLDGDPSGGGNGTKSGKDRVSYI